MTRYQLLKLISWAGTLHSRKRLQKVAYLLQAAGCPLEAEYYLDIIGPYSEDVRHRLDELVVLSLLVEQVETIGESEIYNYRLTDEAKEQLARFERTEEGRGLPKQMAPFESLARTLLRAEPKELEVAGTLLYLQRQGRDWPQALEKTRTYKHLPADSPLVTRAEKLARLVEDSTRKEAALRWEGDAPMPSKDDS
jgi:uncharacterized protein YwgA